MSRQPDPWKSLRDEFRKLQDQIRRMQAASPFFGTGFHPNGNNGIESDDFDGDLDAGNAGSKGWALNSSSAAIGELFLRPGSVSNDALSSPVSPLTAHTDGTNFGLTTGANVNKVVLTIPVPAGYTKALVIANANMNALNSTASADYGYLGIRVDGTSIGWSLASYAPAGIFCSVSNAASELLTSLGTSFTVSASASSSVANWAADSNNTVNLDAMVLFLR